jgi:fatty-acyl-CoA synthase
MADGNFLPADGESQGELVLRAPWLTEGYYNEPQKARSCGPAAGCTPATWRPSTHGVIDIRDRIKDVIKTGGEWISSLDLEDLVSRHPAVREVAVVGIADPQWGERPFALLVVREGHVIDARELKEHLKPFVEWGTSASGRFRARSPLLLKFPRPVSASSTRSASASTSSNGRPTAPSFPPFECLLARLVARQPTKLALGL